MSRLAILGTLLVVIALAIAACDGTDSADEPTTVADTTTTTTAGDPVSSGVGPGISVAEALESTAEGPFLVNGFIVTEEDGTVLLAELLAESLPPLAGGATLIVEGLDLDTFPGLKTAQGITWSDQPVQLLGDVADGVLTVSELSTG